MSDDLKQRIWRMSADILRLDYEDHENDEQIQPIYDAFLNLIALSNIEAQITHSQEMIRPIALSLHVRAMSRGQILSWFDEHIAELEAEKQRLEGLV